MSRQITISDDEFSILLNVLSDAWASVAHAYDRDDRRTIAGLRLRLEQEQEQAALRLEREQEQASMQAPPAKREDGEIARAIVAGQTSERWFLATMIRDALAKAGQFNSKLTFTNVLLHIADRLHPKGAAGVRAGTEPGAPNARASGGDHVCACGVMTGYACVDCVAAGVGAIGICWRDECLGRHIKRHHLEGIDGSMDSSSVVQDLLTTREQVRKLAAAHADELAHKDMDLKIARAQVQALLGGGTRVKAGGIDLELLAKFADGIAGARTGAMIRAGYLSVQVTAAGIAALGRPPVDTNGRLAEAEHALLYEATWITQVLISEHIIIGQDGFADRVGDRSAAIFAAAIAYAEIARVAVLPKPVVS